MLIFNRLHDQLQAQQQQLGSVIKQVNALIDHRVEKEKHILKGTKKKKKIGGSGAKEATKKQRTQRSKISTNRSKGASTARQAPKQQDQPDKGIEEEDKDASAR